MRPNTYELLKIALTNCKSIVKEWQTSYEKSI